MSTPLTARNADITDLVAILQEQQAAKVDLVTPLVNLRMTNGIATIAGTSVFSDGEQFRPTEIADGHCADKFGIPSVYLRRMRSERVDLYDANVNGWIHGSGDHIVDAEEPGKVHYVPCADADPRTVTLRTFQGEPGSVGVLRAMLSDRAGIIDNFDILLAGLDGAKEAGVNVQVSSADLTETRMVVKLDAPEVNGAFPKFLEGYRNPFGPTSHYGNLGDPVRNHPGHVVGEIVSAGLVITNSETGHGAFNISPRFTVWACSNGLTITKDALRKIHIGRKMEEGVIEWSSDTQKKALELITAQTRDAVATFLRPEYLHSVMADIETKAGKPVEHPEEQIKVIAKQVGFSEAHAAGILNHFIKGGQLTAGGVMQAVTSFAQEVEDADIAFEMEQAALKVLELVAAD